MAGPMVMSAVPGRILRGSSPGAAGRSAATPTSTTQTSAPAWVAIAFTTAPEARKLVTIWAVTSCGHGVTPWACTPWSPANTATTAGSGSGGGHSRASPASCTDTCSSTPSEPLGLVSASCRSRACATASASSGPIAAMVSAIRLAGGAPGSPRRPHCPSCTAQDSGRRRAQPLSTSSGAGGNASTCPTHRYATTCRYSGRPSAAASSRSSKKLTQPTPRPSARAASQKFCTAHAVEYAATWGWA